MSESPLSLRRRARGRFGILRLFFSLTFACSTLIMPMTAACQRQRLAETGIEELRALVLAAGGSPQTQELLRFEAKHSRTRAAALAKILRGYLAYTKKDYRGAIDALDSRATGIETALGDYALLIRGDSESSSGAFTEALADYRALVTNHSDSLNLREARLSAARSQLALGRVEDVLTEITQLANAGDPDAIYIMGQALEAKGAGRQAIDAYRRIYYEFPATTASVQAETRLQAFNQSPSTNPASYEDELARCDRLFESGRYFEASTAYEGFIAAFRDHPIADKTQLRYGVSLLNNKQPAQAAIELDRVTDRDERLKAEADMYLADALRKSNRTTQSLAIVDRLLAKHPSSRWAEEALYSATVYLKKEDRSIELANRYRQLLNIFPKSRYASEASYMLGWLAYQARRYADAARLLEQHLATYRYPDTKFIGEAGLWAAKSEERLGKRSRALFLYDAVDQRYRYGYHGYIAGLRARRLRSADPSLKPEQAAAGSDLERIRQNIAYVEPIKETTNGSESIRVEKAKDLEVIGLNDLALKELNAALETATGSPRINLLIAQLYARSGENFQATLALRRGYPDIYSYRDDEVPREAWEIFFPLNNWETIKQEARRYHIDPYEAAGLIRQESVFSPTAVSRAGARGLMQVMPATGQLISKRQGSGSITASDLFNPTLNVKLGMSYLAQLLDQFGRIEYAAAAYNAGPGRAQRWIAERGSLDIEDWIEAIPFSETRGYVQGVLRYSANYRRFYKE